MGIRIKIALGFALLTIVVISVVSFWAAQSIGFSLDSSDLSKLEVFRQQLVKKLAEEQRTLDRLAAETAEALAAADFFADSHSNQQRHIEKIKSALGADWLEIFIAGKPTFFFNPTFTVPQFQTEFPVRIAHSGPFSYKGYLATKVPFPGKPDVSLCMARTPLLENGVPEFFALFDSIGVLFSKGFNPDFKHLMKLARENITHEMQVEENLYRIRVFNHSNDRYIMTGYPAQRATLSRSLVDELMLRLALLEVIGLLLLGFFLGRKLFAPLGALKHGIEQIAAGHWKEIPLDQPPMQNSGYEIENVARSFNMMVRELSSAQTRLIEVQKELAKKDKMAALGRFSAGIAHEINNPLGTILVTAGMLKEAAAGGTAIAPEDFDAILEETRRCRDIISTLRTYTGRTQPQLTAIPASELIAQIRDFLAHQTAFSDIGFEIDFPDNSDMNLMIDLKAMYQVFNNLVKNAQDAMAELADKKVRIHTELLTDHCCVTIQDAGKGFDCLPEHIFEPLFTTKAQGTGLGLVICQAIIEGHHGTIEARRIDERTELIIKLPTAEMLEKAQEEKTQ